MLYIGIDLGTSAVKLLLMNEAGQILNVVSRTYPLEFPRPGWSQQNPEDWRKAVWEGIPALLEGFDRAQVAGIGAGGQMHGLVVLDEADRVIRPAILWNDGRTAQQVVYLNETVGKDRLSAWTANIAFAGFTAPKLLWMRENEPELFAEIKKIMLPKDYINYLLTGVHSTDYSDASGTLLLDVAKREHHKISPNYDRTYQTNQIQLDLADGKPVDVTLVREELSSRSNTLHKAVCRLLLARIYAAAGKRAEARGVLKEVTGLKGDVVILAQARALQKELQAES